MTPRERYEAADQLLDEHDRTGEPRLLIQAVAHVNAAEAHLMLCPHPALEVPDGP